MASSDLFVAGNLLEACQGWQEMIDWAPNEEAKNATINMACSSLGAIDGFYGTQRVIVRSGMAIILKDAQVETSAEGIKYRDVTAKGWLGKIIGMEIQDQPVLAWPIYDATVLRKPEIEPMADIYQLAAGNLSYQTDGSRRPVYLPVKYIDYALCAA